MRRVRRYLAARGSAACRAVRAARGACRAGRAARRRGASCAARTAAPTRRGAACSAPPATPAASSTRYTPDLAKVLTSNESLLTFKPAKKVSFWSIPHSSVKILGSIC